jgi:hypothetical protein
MGGASTSCHKAARSYMPTLYQAISWRPHEEHMRKVREQLFRKKARELLLTMHLALQRHLDYI